MRSALGLGLAAGLILGMAGPADALDPPRGAGAAAAAKQRIRRLLPPWRRRSAPVERVETSPSIPKLGQKSTAPHIPRGSTEYTNAFGTILSDAEFHHAGVPHDVLERISLDVLEELWPAEGVAVTTYVPVLAVNRVRARVEAYLATAAPAASTP